MPEISSFLFLPPKEISDKVGHISEPSNSKQRLESSTSYHIFTPKTTYHSFVGGMVEFIYGFYGVNVFDRNRPGQFDSVLSTANVIKEAISNGMCHGNREAVVLGLFLGKEGACYGFQDFGEYFKRKEVKVAWESRNKDLPFFRDNHNPPIIVGGCASGMGFGISLIFENSEVYVDNSLGVLYCMQMKNRIIPQKGLLKG